MKEVLKGGNRKELHEKKRVHSMEAAKQVKQFGKPNDLIERIEKDESFGLTKEEIEKALNPSNLCGRAPHQVEEYIENTVNPVIQKYEDLIKDINVEVKV